MEPPNGLFFNKAKRFRWNSNNVGQREDNQAIGLPFEVSECLGKIANSHYLQDLSPLKEAQLNSKSIYAMATAHMQPNYFWLQYSLSKSKAPDSMYSSIIKSINSPSHYKAKKNKYLYKDICVGICCNAQFKDGSWYRALVTQKIGDDYVKALYPDYGNIETVPLEDLVKPGQSHFSVPLQAFCACLYNIRPKHQDMWQIIGDRMKKFFDDHLNDDLVVKIRRVRSDYVVDCDIFLVTRNDEQKISTNDKLYRKHIAQDIVDEGLASFIDPEAAHAIKEDKKFKFNIIY